MRTQLTITLCVAALATGMATGMAAAKCNYGAGDVVSLTDVASVKARLSTFGANLVKDEFETTAEFEARKAALQASLGPRNKFVIRGPLDRDYIWYNADDEEFWIGEFAWDNWGVSWQDALPTDIQRTSGGFKRFAVRGLALKYQTGTYSDGKKYSRMTALYRDYKRYAQNGNAPEWLFDGREVFPNAPVDENLKAMDGKGVIPYNLVRVPVPRSQARDMKANMKIAYEIVPREPFFYSGSSVDYKGGTPVTRETDLIVGRLSCGLVLDQTNRVLKVIRPEI